MPVLSASSRRCRCRDCSSRRVTGTSGSGSSLRSSPCGSGRGCEAHTFASMAKSRKGNQDARLREKTADFFGYIEDFFYVAVAGALAIVGAIYLGYTVYDFVSHAFSGDDFSVLVIELLGGLLLVFIFTEIIHTIRAVIDE